MNSRQQILSAIIAVCIAILAYWWYQGPYGPGGKNKYGITQISWTNTSDTTGNLVLALDRPPASNACDGRATFEHGLVVTPSTTLSAAGAAAVERLLPQMSGMVISKADAGANTVTFANISPPVGWPFAATAVSPQTWTASSVVGDKPSSNINVTPSEKGCP